MFDLVTQHPILSIAGASGFLTSGSTALRSTAWYARQTSNLSLARTILSTGSTPGGIASLRANYYIHSRELIRLLGSPATSRIATAAIALILGVNYFMQQRPQQS